MSTRVQTGPNDHVFVDLGQHDRIREHTSELINSRIESKIAYNVQRFGAANPSVLSHRIDKLEREWDIDRATMAVFATLGSLALILGVTRNKKWLFPLGVQLPFLFYHAVKGWCPPVSVLRRLGFRSHQEIDAERYALKTVRGDFRKIVDP
jgi:hypothetical protein